MGTKEEIKSLIVNEGKTMKSVANKMSELGEKTITPAVLSWKLAKDTLRYSEFKLILKILGYKMTIEKE